MVNVLQADSGNERKEKERKQKRMRKEERNHKRPP